jgi:hypothetical protein
MTAALRCRATRNGGKIVCLVLLTQHCQKSTVGNRRELRHQAVGRIWQLHGLTSNTVDWMIINIGQEISSSEPDSDSSPL